MRWLRTSNPRVSVVTALNPRNAGMYTVDLAASQFLTRIGLAPVLFRGQTRKRRHRETFGVQTFRRLDTSRQLTDNKRVLYWGDFTTSPLFALQEFTRREIDQGGCADQTDALQKWLDLFLLSRSDKSQARVASIGQNFLSLRHQIASLDTGTRNIIGRCYSENFDLVMPRDPVSTEEFSAVSSHSSANLVQGMDCAFLLEHERQFPKLSKDKRNQSFCYAFGRSGLDGNQIVNLVEARTKMKGIALDDWLNLDPKYAHRQVQTLLEKIASSRFIVTDLYHVCINSLSLGTPVLGLGRHSELSIRNLVRLQEAITFQVTGTGRFLRCYRK